MAPAASQAVTRLYRVIFVVIPHSICCCNDTSNTLENIFYKFVHKSSIYFDGISKFNPNDWQINSRTSHVAVLFEALRETPSAFHCLFQSMTRQVVAYDDLECDPDRSILSLSNDSLLLFSAREDMLPDECGRFSSISRVAEPRTRCDQPRQPVHHSHPPSFRASSRCLAFTLVKSAFLLVFSAFQNLARNTSHSSLNVALNGFASNTSFSISPPGARSSSGTSPPPTPVGPRTV